MDNTEDFFGDTKKKLEDYIQKRLLLFRLQTVEKTSKLVAVLITGLVMGVLAFFILLFLSIMAGYFFAAVTGSEYAGFGIVAVFYIVFLIILIKLRKKVLQKFLTNTLIQIFFDQTAEPDDDAEQSI